MADLIPLEALDDWFGITGQPGAGKTYAMLVQAERILHGGHRAILVDPLDVAWGLRLDPTGKTASRFDVAIFGGEHGDLPLTEASGALIGQTVATMRESCIISTAGLPSQAAERRFMLSFLRALERHATGEPVHLIFDEADMWAPQRVLDKDGEANKLLGQMERIVRRNRVKGLIPWLITQRPAVLNKNVLGMMGAIVAMKTTAPLDRKAIGDWIKLNADPEKGNEILDRLPSMQPGEGIVWIPSRGILTSGKFPQRATFDSSRTPKRGETRDRPTLKPLDFAKLKSALAHLEAEALANDPVRLKAEVARLQRALNQEANMRGTRAPPDPAALDHARLVGHADGFRLGHLAGQELAYSRARTALTDAAHDFLVDHAAAATEPPEPRQDTPRPTRALPKAASTPPAVQAPSDGDVKITPAKQRVLNALAWWEAAGFASIDRRRACIMTGLSPKASTFGVYVADLSGVGMIDTSTPGIVALTDAGRAAAEPPRFDGPRALIDACRNLLSPAEAKIFDLVVAHHPSQVRRGDLADEAGLSRVSSTLGVYLAKIAGFGMIETTPGSVRAANWLFPEAPRG